jgi:hypothetical protein
MSKISNGGNTVYAVESVLSEERWGKGDTTDPRSNEIA